MTKPLAAACALWLVDRGRIGLDARVADVWPEYAAGGKEETTLRQLLCHQAGLLAWREPQPVEALLDHGRAAELLAAEPAWWLPGSAHGEHAPLCGIGGSIGWADPARGLAWAYVTTRMGDHERALAVERALIAANG